MQVGDGRNIAARAHGIGDALFCETVAEMHLMERKNLLIGLCGAQGSGKSTRAEKLLERLRSRGFMVALLSLDDFYLTTVERRVLADDIHPLLRTRGVPGTHDVGLLTATIDALLSASNSERTPIPSFDKVEDDRLTAERWETHVGRAEIVLLEGWCIGARPQPIEALAVPVNELERDEDSDGRWRNYVNRRLSSDYAELFARLDLRLMLRAPSFSNILEWKLEQERNLPRNASYHPQPMDAAEMARFVSHYERLTRWMLDDEPADIVADLNSDRVPVAWRRPLI